MSHIIATVSHIENCDSLHIVKFNSSGETLTMMSLDLGSDIKIGTVVKLAIKPSHITLAKNLSGEISHSNKIETTIISIKNGQLLSSVKLSFFDTVLESIITLGSSQKMNLKEGDRVTALIKSSELSIGEVLY